MKRGHTVVSGPGFMVGFRLIALTVTVTATSAVGAASVGTAGFRSASSGIACSMMATTLTPAIPLTAVVPMAPVMQNRSSQQLQVLAAPIALMPDPVLAEIIAASNFWSSISQANQVLVAGGNAAQLRQLALPAPVRVIAALPDLLREVGQRRDWVLALNQASRRQSAALFAAIQDLRSIAAFNGALVDGPEVNLSDRSGAIAIEPADTSGVSVPSYDPSVVFAAGLERGSLAPISYTGWVPMSVFTDPIEIDWANGRISNGWGPWFSSTLGRDSRGNVIASGTYTVLGSRPGYEGMNWRPNGTVVIPGSRSTQGHALEPMEPLPWVLPTQPLMPAQPLQPVSRVAPAQPLRPIAPVQSLAYRRPVQPLQPVQPIPSNLAGGSAFWSGDDGGAASARGARSVGRSW